MIHASESRLTFKRLRASRGPFHYFHKKVRFTCFILLKKIIITMQWRFNKMQFQTVYVLRSVSIIFRKKSTYN